MSWREMAAHVGRLDPLHPADELVKTARPSWLPFERTEPLPWVLYLILFYRLQRQEALVGLQQAFLQDTRAGHAKLTAWLSRLRRLGYHLKLFPYTDLVKRCLGNGERPLVLYVSPFSQTHHPLCGMDAPQRAEAARRAIQYAVEQDRVPAVVNRVTDLHEYAAYWIMEGMSALRGVHDVAYLGRLQEPRPGSPKPLYPGGEEDSVLGPQSWKAMVLYATMAVNALHDIREGKARRAFVAGRPPGHHAGIRGRTTSFGAVNQEAGFCFVNTAAAVAKLASRKGFDRVLLIDMDVHHGNGTEEIVRADPTGTLAFVSMHRKGQDGGDIFPGTGHGNTNDARILNLHNGDSRVTEHWISNTAWPRVREFAEAFDPRLIVVSAGFDAARGDIMNHGTLSAAFYKTLAGMMVDLAEERCGGKLLAVQEGGYLAAYPDDLPEMSATADVTYRPLLGCIRKFIAGLGE